IFLRGSLRRRTQTRRHRRAWAPFRIRSWHVNCLELRAEAAMISTIDCIEVLVKLAEDGNLTKSVLADSLTPEARYAFLDKCAAIEQRLTTQCSATGETCLESGCALEGEACLNAVLNADVEYH